MNQKHYTLIAIIGLIIIFHYNGILKLFTLDNLLEKRDTLTQYVSNNYSFAVIGYVAVYIISISFSIPGATILTLAGGYLFGILGLPMIIWV
jgi:uncharacterized membrane protein YdjX (TVP38/TMEM64 family)